MAIITISYPESGLSGTVSVVNLSTAVQDFSGSLTEVGTTKLYKYEFTEVSGQSYVYTITVAGYSNYVDSIIYETASGGLTAEQDAELTQIYNRVDENVSAIAVGWNPYIGDMKKGMNSVIKKIEDKGEEVKTKIETEVKSIVIPEQKEPIVNVTTEKIDTEQFMKAIKDIPAPIVNVTTETVNIEPIITEIKKIGKIEDIEFPEYPEQKEMDMSGMEKCMEEIEEKIDNIPDNTEMIKKIVDFIDKKEEEERNEEKMKEEEENMNRPLPNSFIAELK